MKNANYATIFVVLTALMFPRAVHGTELQNAHKLTVGEVEENDWPTIAENQDVQGRVRLQIVSNIVSPDKKCPDPCAGGRNCAQWELSSESYCVSVGAYSSECRPAPNFWCVHQTLSDTIDAGTGQAVTLCKTCLY